MMINPVNKNMTLYVTGSRDLMSTVRNVSVRSDTWAETER